MTAVGPNPTQPARMYGDPKSDPNQESSVGKQIRLDHYVKKALIEAKKEQYFSPLADVQSMPKHMGKTIKRYHYLPILDDANINDQGIDAAGATTTMSFTIIITRPDVTSTGNGWVSDYAVGEGANAGAAQTDAEAVAEDIFKNYGVFNTDYATTKAALEALTPPWTIDDTGSAVPARGNLYGSSKDVGTIVNKLPLLSETGGRVNRVGHRRVMLEGTIHKYGMFSEYTQESLDFDTDAELDMHCNREMIFAANELTEDLLQVDLLNHAGVIYYGGDATSDSQMTGEGATPSVITYEDLMKLSIELDDNRTPKNTKIITGTRMIDTKVVDSCRVMYIGSEVEPVLRKMVDPFNNPAFIPVQHYAAGTTLLNGEIGSIYQFRIVVVPEMMHWAGVGAPVTTNPGYRESNGQYNVYPMLVVGSEAFTTIGFQTDGKTVKFVIHNRKPGKETADRLDPYGELGFMSIKFYYGFMILRPERLALCKTVAEW